jgi:formate dehydrogenase
MKVLAILYPGESQKNNPQLLGCAEQALGLRYWLESNGHHLVVTSDLSDNINNELKDSDVVIATPFWPLYLSQEKINKAINLKLLLTAGVGSDHFDLAAACARHITVAEITGSNVVSVAEHAVMQILALVRNYIPCYQDVITNGWHIGELAAKSHDLEGKTVGLLGLGRIGQRVASRLKPFDVKVLYHDIQQLNSNVADNLGVRYCEIDELISSSDVLSLHCPLTPKTENLVNSDFLCKMKKGAYLVNTARGALVDTDALVTALETEHLAGYAGDVWYPQPAPPDHIWRTMRNHGLTPHISGTTLEAQQRYSAGVKECLEAFFNGQPIKAEYLIADQGKIVSPSYCYAY